MLRLTNLICSYFLRRYYLEEYAECADFIGMCTTSYDLYMCITKFKHIEIPHLPTNASLATDINDLFQESVSTYVRPYQLTDMGKDISYVECVPSWRAEKH